MMWYNVEGYNQMWSWGTFVPPFFAFSLMSIFLIWTFVWKGLGLWHAARNARWGWFIALLLINTGGLLEIFFLFFVLKMKGSELFEESAKKKVHHSEVRGE